MLSSPSAEESLFSIPNGNEICFVTTIKPKILTSAGCACEWKGEGSFKQPHSRKSWLMGYRDDMEISGLKVAVIQVEDKGRAGAGRQGDTMG